ncbi:MAG: AmmeMemoRadiSam system protein B, partial [Pseudomonadota bacterium]
LKIKVYTSKGYMMVCVRPTAVAGHFYSNASDALKNDLQHYFGQVDQLDVVYPKQTKAVIAPHAGYRYSGFCAAVAYQAFCQPMSSKPIKRVVLLGPAHRVGFEGAGLCSADYWETPLGAIRVDMDACKQLIKFSTCRFIDQAHQMEHCLEVHLPFIQHLFPEASIVPILISQADFSMVAQILEHFWNDEDTRIIISSDLSHYNPLNLAKKIDLETADAIEHFKTEKLNGKAACGFKPIGGLLQLAQTNKFDVTRLYLCNSGDIHTSKPPDFEQMPVVGYGAWAISPAKTV